MTNPTDRNPSVPVAPSRPKGPTAADTFADILESAQRISQDKGIDRATEYASVRFGNLPTGRRSAMAKFIGSRVTQYIHSHPTDPTRRFADFIRDCLQGSPVVFPDPDAPEAPDFIAEPTSETPEASVDVPNGWAEIEADDPVPILPEPLPSLSGGSPVVPTNFSDVNPGDMIDLTGVDFTECPTGGTVFEVIETRPYQRYLGSIVIVVGDDRVRLVWPYSQPVNVVPPITGGSPEAAPVAEDATDSALIGRSRLARTGFDPSGSILRAEMKAVEHGIRAEVLPIIEVQRDGTNGPDDMTSCHWRASLVWSKMDPSEQRDFARWLGQIGYQPGFRDYGTLAPDEAFEVFVERCITGESVSFPQPINPDDDDKDSSTSYNTDRRGIVTPPPILNTPTRQGVRHAVAESYHADRVQASSGVPALPSGERRIDLEPNPPSWPVPGSLRPMAPTQGPRQQERVSRRDPVHPPGEQGLHETSLAPRPDGVRRPPATGDGSLSQPRPGPDEQQPVQPPVGHPPIEHGRFGQAREKAEGIVAGECQTHGRRHPDHPKSGDQGSSLPGDRGTIQGLEEDHREDHLSRTVETRPVGVAHFSGRINPWPSFLNLEIHGKGYGVTIREDCIMLERPDGVTYEVTVTDDGPACTCPAFQFTCKGLPGALCKHARAIRESGLIRGLSSPASRPTACQCNEHDAARAFGMG